jgi:hypothetical protein
LPEQGTAHLQQTLSAPTLQTLAQTAGQSPKLFSHFQLPRSIELQINNLLTAGKSTSCILDSEIKSWESFSLSNTANKELSPYSYKCFILLETGSADFI